MDSARVKMSPFQMNMDDLFLIGGEDNSGADTVKIEKFNGLAWEELELSLPYPDSFIGVAQNNQDNYIYLVGGMDTKRRMSKWNRVGQDLL